MPKICYVNRRFSPASLAMIDKANTIIEEYEAQGFALTLRQLYYQFVARDLIANSMRAYKNLGSVVNDGRLAGLIDWDHITDRTRNLERLPHWDDPSGVIHSAAAGYHIDMWENQSFRPEVWIEKDALIGVIEDVCDELDVPYFSCRGYTSQSEMWSAGMRLQRYVNSGQTPVILHLGDHDPSGKDMTRDVTDRLAMFMGGLKVDRLALNMNQVNRYNPPPNPAKITDSRAAAYIAEFGNESWELDALEPKVMTNLIRRSVLKLQNKKTWADDHKRWLDQRELLEKAAENWDRVTQILEEED